MAHRTEMLQPEQTNRSLQKQMAECLLSADLDEAIEFATRNGWQGVLRELYGLTPALRNGGPRRPVDGMGERWEKGRKNLSTEHARPTRTGRPRAGIGKKRRKRGK